MDLLQSQIKESCNLALPEGLKDLMSDISREVLRGQTNDIPQFIADYLEVLLEVREKLSIACEVCNNTYNCVCESELYTELKTIGLNEEDIDNAIKIIDDHFKKGNVTEQSIFIKLAKKISIDEMQLSSMQDAIQKAFKRHHIKHGVLSKNTKEYKEVTNACRHTLDLYKNEEQITKEVFMSSIYKPFSSTVSSTSLAESFAKFPKSESNYRSANDTERQQAAHDYTQDHSTSTGKVTFIEEKQIFEIKHECDKATDSVDADVGDIYGDEVYEGDESHGNDVIGDEANLTDSDVEEMIERESNDGSASSIDEECLM